MIVKHDDEQPTFILQSRYFIRISPFAHQRWRQVRVHNTSTNSTMLQISKGKRPPRWRERRLRGDRGISHVVPPIRFRDLSIFIDRRLAIVHSNCKRKCVPARVGRSFCYATSNPRTFEQRCPSTTLIIEKIICK